MSSNAPIELTSKEWDELADIEFVRESWGLGTGERGAALALNAYAARFDFVSGSPGFCGDVFMVIGDYLSAAPLVFIRDERGRLSHVDFKE